VTVAFHEASLQVVELLAADGWLRPVGDVEQIGGDSLKH